LRAGVAHAREFRSGWVGHDMTIRAKALHSAPLCRALSESERERERLRALERQQLQQVLVRSGRSTGGALQEHSVLPAAVAPHRAGQCSSFSAHADLR